METSSKHPDLPPATRNVRPRAASAATLILFSLLALGTMGCSLTSFIRLIPPPTPGAPSLAFLTPTTYPTFTPTVPAPTDTPVPPTPTITPTATDTPTPLPTTADFAASAPVSPTPSGPLIEVPVAEVNTRQGPGIDYQLATTIRQGETYQIVGRNADYSWWLICCVGGQQVWVTSNLVRVIGDATDVQFIQVAPPPPPTPTPGPPTATPTITPTPTEEVNFDIELVEEFPTSPDNDWLKVGAEIKSVGGAPLWGYRLRAVNEATGESFTSPLVSDSSWHYSTVDYRLFNGTPAPDYRRVNLQFDTNGLSSGGDARWQIFVVDGGGNIRESSIARVTTSETQPKWFYVQFKRRF
jgi:hypothetical protein